jgi:ribonuclease HI
MEVIKEATHSNAISEVKPLRCSEGQDVTIYTAGYGTEGEGVGAGAVSISSTGRTHERAWLVPASSHKDAELFAVVNALKKVGRLGRAILVVTRAAFVECGLHQVKKWRKQGWKDSRKKRVPHQALWEELEALSKKHYLSWASGGGMGRATERAKELARSVATSQTKSGAAK